MIAASMPRGIDRKPDLVWIRPYRSLVRPHPLWAIGTLCLSVFLTSSPVYADSGMQPAPNAAGTHDAQHYITDLIGANGWPGSADDYRYWKAMGLTWGRDSVGPGRATSPDDPMRIDRTDPGFGSPLPPILLENNRHGIHSLLLLGYTPPWNAEIPGDTKSAPIDERYWTEYVEAVVKRYTAPPYNIKYFQIWNEAAGPLSGGSAQATFWHGPSDPGTAHPGAYTRAMQDYVDLIHIPAARIIHRYHAYVVYGGWPDQGGLDTYMHWLEYESPTEHTRMIDNVDYLDIHYLGIDAIDRLYTRYVATGKVRGIWETEIGDRYMINPHYLAKFYFKLAVWALGHRWTDANQYVAMVYHWDGLEPFRLTHRGTTRSYNPSGRSLVTLKQVVNGPLSACGCTVHFDRDADGDALEAGGKLIVQLSAIPGSHHIEIDHIPATDTGHLHVSYIDAISGQPVADAKLTFSLSGQDHQDVALSFDTPPAGLDADRKPLAHHLGYLVLVSTPAS